MLTLPKQGKQHILEHSSSFVPKSNTVQNKMAAHRNIVSVVMLKVDDSFSEDEESKDMYLNNASYAIM